MPKLEGIGGFFEGLRGPGRKGRRGSAEESAFYQIREHASLVA